MWKVGLCFMGGSFLLLGFGVWMLGLGVVVFIEYVFGGAVGGLSFVWVFDWVSVFFYFVVLFISGLIMIYSVDYMGGDSSLDRFVLLMVGFVLSMGLVVFSSNVVVLLFGWDGLGLTSYCLVIYYQNNSSFNAGMITILSNRVGDVGLLGGLALMFGLGGLNYVELSSGGECLVLLGFLFFLAGITSSAQVPFSAWLPAAMAAPTPVSSLVHSSTLVAAGVFLMVRLSGMLGWVADLLFLLGLVTMFMAGVGANYEMDLSSVVALSTLSQLGVMMMIVSLGEWQLAYFHMVVHALFSAMMFMSVGFVIHGFGGWQDVRVMGGLGGYFPFVGVGMMVSGMALMGFPFMAGFYSKDLILESVMVGVWGWIIVLVVVLSFLMTVGYSMSIFRFVLWGQEGVGVIYFCWGESPWMAWSIFGLVFMSVFGGAVGGWLFLPVGSLLVLGFEKWVGIFIVVFGILFSVVFDGGSGGSLVGVVEYFFGGMWFIWYLSANPLVSLMYVCDLMSVGDDLWGEIVGGSGGSFLILGGVSAVLMIQEVELSGVLVLGLLGGIVVVLMW
uniref:NADH dehydrogenase subunit 5 n=1 Tax=Charinus ferreus TaxID=3034938 RepID=UPI002410E2A4|nr:NADH dehydrogenase subunit 5 [Charinus ferreus]WEM34690.1 NADH dehydrogenase subunit 5 [Charinus ferreus]WEM34703.1 NADH dehydrogenase subunit 5 [Charinus ferreus]